jgi:hypothetical protein
MEKPLIRLNFAADDDNDGYCRRFYETLAQTKTLFRKEDGSLWIILPGARPDRVNTLEEFQGKIHNVAKIVRSGQRGQDMPAGLDREHGRLLYYSTEMLSLPLLRSVVYEPAAVHVGNGAYRLTQPGYAAENGIYYWVAPDERPIEPLEGVHHLTTAFSGVPFEREEYRNNLIAWLLGAVTLDPRVEAPMIVVTGNTQGIGKSKTVESAGYILTGQSQAPVDQHSEEFEKGVGTRFSEGIRFISLDNVVSGSGSYKNPRLARLLTSGYSKKVRILGHSRSVEQKGVQVALSANGARLERDLATRSLPVKLYCAAPGPMDPYVLDYVQDHRREVYGELLWLACQDVEPIAVNTSSEFRFRRWLEFTLPRVKKFFGSMAIEEASELDDEVIELFSWGSDLEEDTRFDVSELEHAALSNRDKFPALSESLSNLLSQKGRRRYLTLFLRRYCDRVFHIDNVTPLLLKEYPAQSHRKPNKYGFQKVKEDQNAEGN